MFSLRRYLAVEMAVAAAISAVLSVIFVFLIFGARATVPVGGSGGLIVDALPQSAMIALMSSLVPTLLTRRRVRVGVVVAGTGRVWRPNHALAAPLAGVAHAVLMPLGPPQWRFGAVLAFKPLYGALLGALVARWAVIAAPADPVRRAPAGSSAATDRRDG